MNLNWRMFSMSFPGLVYRDGEGTDGHFEIGESASKSD